MIPAFVEGLAQSLLPCSWIVVIPAAAVATASRRLGVLFTFGTVVAVAAWTVVTGIFDPPVWIAGVAILAGSIWWWLGGADIGPAALVGFGAAWAWQPCVGERLGEILNTAQRDALGALPGMLAFMLALVVVGYLIGFGIRWLRHRFTKTDADKPVAALLGVLGVTMLLGLYSTIASQLARWSVEIWS